MKPIRTLLKPSLVAVAAVLALATSIGIGSAQSPQVSTEVDRTELSTDETVTLTVFVDAAGFVLPPSVAGIDGFVLISRGTTSRTTVINGEITTNVFYNFVLQPTRTGTLTIGAVTVVVDGKAHTTDPITVEVTRGTGVLRPDSLDIAPESAPATLSGQDHFVEALIDDPAPYLGQQVIYKLRYYRAVDGSRTTFGPVGYDPPPFDGLWDAQHSDSLEYDLAVQGRRYRVFERHTILYPTVVGPLTVPPSNFTIPGGLFERDTLLQTRPVELTVRPLPGGAPAGFDGAVGSFEISAALDEPAGKAGEPLTLSVVITGQGNFDTLPEPAWPDMPGWRTFDGSSSTHTQVVHSQVRGNRTYERILIPDAPGELTVPPVSYTYFDPVDEEYRTIVTEALSVTVLPGLSQTTPGAAISPDVQPDDIKHIKPAVFSFGSGDSGLGSGDGRAVTSRPWFWALWAIVPLVTVAAAEGWRRRGRPAAGGPDAPRPATRPDGPNSSGDEALTAYLGSRLNRPVTGLTADALVGLLTARGVEPSVVQRVSAWVLAREAGRYAPAGGQSDEVEGRGGRREPSSTRSRGVSRRETPNHHTACGGCHRRRAAELLPGVRPGTAGIRVDGGRKRPVRAQPVRRRRVLIRRSRGQRRLEQRPLLQPGQRVLPKRRPGSRTAQLQEGRPDRPGRW